jgi:hypothetical protein
LGWASLRQQRGYFYQSCFLAGVQMKKRFENRKAFQQIAKEIGIQDRTVQVIMTNPTTKKESFHLVNNFNRFVDGMLKLTPMEQVEKLQVFRSKMEELQADQERARAEAQKSIDDIKIENPMVKVAQEVLGQDTKEPGVI